MLHMIFCNLYNKQQSICLLILVSFFDAFLYLGFDYFFLHFLCDFQIVKNMQITLVFFLWTK